MYSDVSIKNIRRGRKEDNRDKFIYAELVNNKTGEVLISATLDYITEVLPSRLP